MAITTAVAKSFKQELFAGTHVLATDTIKVALIKASMSGTFNGDTDNYSDLGSDEVTSANYTAGGQTLAGYALSVSGSTIIIDWTDPEWTSVSFTARGMLIYNSSKSNKAIAVYDFGDDYPVNGTFIIQMPTADASNAILRLT